jgi:hypothetical protein
MTVIYYTMSPEVSTFDEAAGFSMPLAQPTTTGAIVIPRKIAVNLRPILQMRKPLQDASKPKGIREKISHSSKSNTVFKTIAFQTRNEIAGERNDIRLRMTIHNFII